MIFKQKLENTTALVNRALSEFLPPADTKPEEIHQAMRYSVLAGGKRLRPVLALAAAELGGLQPEMILPAACALEFLHTYSLIHDDLPAMDNDDFRRGMPTCHKKFGEALAILAGDALLTKAFELLTWGNFPAELKMQVLREVAEAAGSQGLIGGQAADIRTEQEISEANLLYIHQHKTGELLTVAVRTGAVLSGLQGAKLEALTAYARYLGLAFQITDDILDLTGEEIKLGKPLFSDQKNAKLTYPALFGLEKSKAMAWEIMQQGLQCLDIFSEEADFLAGLLQFVVKRDY